MARLARVFEFMSRVEERMCVIEAQNRHRACFERRSMVCSKVPNVCYSRMRSRSPADVARASNWKDFGSRRRPMGDQTWAKGLQNRYVIN